MCGERAPRRKECQPIYACMGEELRPCGSEDGKDEKADKDWIAPSRNEGELEAEQGEGHGKQWGNAGLQAPGRRSTRCLEECHKAEQSHREPRHGEPEWAPPGARGGPCHALSV